TMTSFRLLGKRVEVRDGTCIDDQGTLAGSNLDMASSVRNTIDLLGVEAAEAVGMASRHPAAFLGLPHTGRIAPGRSAALSIATPGMTIVDTWIDGRISSAAGRECRRCGAGACGSPGARVPHARGRTCGWHARRPRAVRR